MRQGICLARITNLCARENLKAGTRTNLSGRLKVSKRRLYQGPRQVNCEFSGVLSWFFIADQASLAAESLALIKSE